ncbi:HAD-IA family hydrolase [Candidatus Bipolaricaulota bacterium]|nr:HAD-IA family hydrolase [Candidatus Bipolaricaulota bacterium]
MIKGVIFDFDGLILDTELPVFRAWQEIFASHGQELSLDDWVDYIGRSPDSFDPCDDLERLLGHPVDRQAIRTEHRRREASLIESEGVLPGVVDLIAQARELKLRLGIASSSERAWVIGHLSRLGLDKYFDTIRCSDDVEHTKPAADLYLGVIAEWAIAPQEAFALEDSPHGVSAAKAAGMFCIAVPNEMTKNLTFDHADLVLPSLEGTHLEDLLRNLGVDGLRPW